MTFQCECGKQYALENSMIRHRREGKCPIHAGWNPRTERKKKPVFFGPEPKPEPKKRRGRPAFIGPKPKPVKSAKVGRPPVYGPKPKPVGRGGYKKQIYSPEVMKKRVADRQNKKVTCECGKVVSACNLKTHMRSNKHKLTMEGTWKANQTKGTEYKKKPPVYGPKPKPVPRGTRGWITQAKAKEQKTRVDCECGVNVLFTSMFNHKQTMKHHMAIQAQHCIVIHVKK